LKSPLKAMAMMRIARFTLLALVLFLPAAVAAGQILEEKISVVNVEVPVRIFLGGVPLDSLKKGDFQLFENNEPQEINGFYLRRKKMNVHQVAIQANRAAETLPPRYFVLVFRILEYNQQMQKGLDYFFSDILREQDRLLVLANDRTVSLDRDVWQIHRREILEQVLREEAVKARQELESYFVRVGQDVDQNQLRLLIDNSTTYGIFPIITFLERYLEVWREFKIKYLVPDLGKFYNFARHLEGIKAEKWVLNFYQFEMFPKLKIDGRLRRQIDGIVARLESEGGSSSQFARVITRLQDTIDRELNVANEFPAEQIGKMLTGVDTTYHCLISGVEREGLSEDLEYKRVASDLEKSLREITTRSGGVVVFSGDIDSALHSIGEKEDVYYVLTYAPKDPERRGKIAVKVNDKRLRLLYDDRQRSDYIAQYVQDRKLSDPTVQLRDLSFAGGKLHFGISDFRMPENEGKTTARLNVVLRIRDGAGTLIYDQARAINARIKTVAVDIGFEWLKPGRYIFFIEVHDLLSGRTAMDILAAEI
jgi:hypothetical protein